MFEAIKKSFQEVVSAIGSEVKNHFKSGLDTFINTFKFEGSKAEHSKGMDGLKGAKPQDAMKAMKGGH